MKAFCPKPKSRMGFSSFCQKLGCALVSTFAGPADSGATSAASTNRLQCRCLRHRAAEHPLQGSDQTVMSHASVTTRNASSDQPDGPLLLLLLVWGLIDRLPARGGGRGVGDRDRSLTRLAAIQFSIVPAGHQR